MRRDPTRRATTANATRRQSNNKRRFRGGRRVGPTRGPLPRRPTRARAGHTRVAAGAADPAPRIPVGPRTPVRLPHGRAAAYVRGAVDRETAQVAAAAPGTSHATLLAAAGKLGQLVGAGALSEPDARAALLPAATAHIGKWSCDCTEQSIRRTIDDGLRYGQQLPRRLHLIWPATPHPPSGAGDRPAPTRLAMGSTPPSVSRSPLPSDPAPRDVRQVRPRPRPGRHRHDPRRSHPDARPRKVLAQAERAGTAEEARRTTRRQRS